MNCSLKSFFKELQPSCRQQNYDLWTTFLANETTNRLNYEQSFWMMTLFKQSRLLYGIQKWRIIEHDDVMIFLWQEFRLWRALRVIEFNLSLVA